MFLFKKKKNYENVHGLISNLRNKQNLHILIKNGDN